VVRMLLAIASAGALLGGPIARAQTPVADAPSFDVASIHESKATDGRHHIYNNPAESHFRTGNLSVRALIQYAYGIPEGQIVGGPAWLDATMYDIDAKSDGAEDAKLHALPSDEARQRKNLMVQALLAERFGLKAHEETRELPVYALVMAKGGAKFTPSQINGTTVNVSRAQMHIAGSDDTLGLLARELARNLGKVVLNQTGLSGRYDLTLRWTPEDGPAPMLNGAPDTSAPDIFTAVQEQLGLKLESTKGPVPVLVLDKVERPSEN
jgi:uncharacterized protein (TIGR03435 family)